MVGSEAMPHGCVELAVARALMSRTARGSVPAVENSCTLELPSSETYRFPPEKARPKAHPSCPFARAFGAELARGMCRWRRTPATR